MGRRFIYINDIVNYYPKFITTSATNSTYSDCDESSGTTLTITYPSGIEKDDVLILHWSQRGSNTMTISGWDTIGGENNSGLQFSSYYFWKRASGNESGTFNVTSSSSEVQIAIISVWRGCIGIGKPFEGVDFEDITSSSSHPSPAISTLGKNRTVALFSTTKYYRHFWGPQGGYDDLTFGGHQYMVAGNGGTSDGISLFAQTLNVEDKDDIPSKSGGYYGDVASQMIMAFIPSRYGGLQSPGIVYGRNGVKTSTGDTSTLDVYYPDDVNTNDIVFILAVSHYGDSITISGNTFNLLKLNDGYDAMIYAVFWKRASGDETTSDYETIVTGDDSDSLHAMMYKFSGCLTVGTPFESFTYEDSAYGNTCLAPSLTSTNDRSLAVNIQFHYTAIWNSSAADYILENSSIFTYGSYRYCMQVSSQFLPSVTSTTSTYGWSSSDHVSSGLGLVLIPDTVSSSREILYKASFYWTFNEGSGNIVSDAIGNNTFKFYGGTEMWDSDGVDGSCVHFEDDTSEYLYQYSSEANFGTGDFSFSFWLNADITGMTLYPNLYQHGAGSTTSQGFWIVWYSSTNEFRLFFCDGTTRLSYYSNECPTVDNGSWHHVVITVDRDDVFKVYVDNNYSGSTDISATSNYDLTSTLALTLGTRWDGRIDQYRIYKDYLLTEDDISTLYNEFSP